MAIAERFWSKVKRGDGCWEWLGAKKSKDPKRAYGQFYLHGKTVSATKVAWELINGRPFPEGMDACHTCDNPPCVNPLHIFAGTARDNLLDAVNKGRCKSYNKSKTHCCHGHPLFGDNLRMRSNGQRQCKQCQRDWYREQKRKGGVHGKRI